MTDKVTVEGRCPPHFHDVVEAFEANFADGLELGASFAAIVDGEIIVNIRGGHSDRARENPWSDETLACIYSSGKAATALLIARAVSEGRLDYDRKVADDWPEFGAAGKDDITLAEVMSHQAGLCGFPGEMPPETWLDWDEICARLCAMAPLWPPRSAAGYHPQTVGFITGELLRRAEGRTVGQLLREDFYESQGLEIHCGLSPETVARAAFMPKPPRAPDLGELTELKRIAFLKPWSAPARVKREDWAAAELPASNMHATALGLAGIVHPFASGGYDLSGERILDPAVIEAALRTRISGSDLVLPFDLVWATGLMANNQGHFGPSATAFGHAGFGGSCVVIDPARRLTAAYVMNKMSPHLVGDPRATRLLGALYAAL